jgi:hypothetical protein
VHPAEAIEVGRREQTGLITKLVGPALSLIANSLIDPGLVPALRLVLAFNNLFLSNCTEGRSHYQAKPLSFSGAIEQAGVYTFLQLPCRKFFVRQEMQQKHWWTRVFGKLLLIVRKKHRHVARSSSHGCRHAGVCVPRSAERSTAAVKSSVT